MNTTQIYLAGLTFLLIIGTVSGAWGIFRSPKRRPRPAPRPNPRRNCSPIVTWSPCENGLATMSNTPRPGRGEQCPTLAEPNQVFCMSRARLITDDCTYLVEYDLTPCGRGENRYPIEVTSGDCPDNHVTIQGRCSRGIMSDDGIARRAVNAGRTNRARAPPPRRRQRGGHARANTDQSLNSDSDSEIGDLGPARPSQSRERAKAEVDAARDDRVFMNVPGPGIGELVDNNELANFLLEGVDLGIIDHGLDTMSNGFDDFSSFVHDIDALWENEQHST